MNPAGGSRDLAAPLSTTARAILTEFADAFPQSAHYRGGRKLRKAGWERVFPETERDVEAKEAFLDAVDELCRLGVISVKWRRYRDGTEVEALYLEDADRLYELADRPSPEHTRSEMLEVLESDAWAGDTIDAVRDHLRALLEARHPVPAETAAELRDLARLLRVSPQEARATPVRALSIRLFGESKRLEALLPLADQLTRRVLGFSFSAETGLSRSYPEVSLALTGTLVVRDADREPRWCCTGEVVTLPAETVARIERVELDRKAGTERAAVLSVENKESFHVLAARLRAGTLPASIRAVTYGGGHPHRSYIHLLELLGVANAELIHFGDLDPDGLLIFRELHDELSAPLQPLLMDVATYRRYLDYGYDPPAPRFDLLAATMSRLPESIQPLATELLSRRRGVEQEVIEIPDRR